MELIWNKFLTAVIKIMVSVTYFEREGGGGGQHTTSHLSRARVRSVWSKPVCLSSWNGDASSNVGLGGGGDTTC
jgi:hypothetical protein